MTSVDVDAFHAALPDEMRTALENLRRAIGAAAPGSGRVDQLRCAGLQVPRPALVSFGATKNRCSFYVQSLAVMDAHRDELASYDTSKGTIRFAPGAPLPDSLLATLIRARMAETDATAKPGR